MNSACSICSDLLTPKSEIFSTSCGHMFHQNCLTKWLETSKTCPQCRHAETTASVHRIYLNFASSEGIVDDVITLQSRLDMISFELSEKNKEISVLKRKYESCKAVCGGLRELIVQSKQAECANKTTLLALKAQLELNREKARHIDHLVAEAERLKESLNGMQDFRNMITACESQVEDMLRSNKDPQAINILIVTLKKQLLVTELSNRALTAKITAIGKDIFKSLGKVDNLAASKEKLHHELVVHECCSSEISYLKQKLRQFEGTPSNANCTITSADESASSTSCTPRMPRKRSLVDLTLPSSTMTVSHDSLGPPDALDADETIQQQANNKRRKPNSAYTLRSKFRKLSSNPTASKSTEGLL